MITTEEFVDEIYSVFEKGEALWPGANYSEQVSSVLFYVTALRLFSRKPFRNEEIQKKVMAFLEKKMDEASEQLLAVAMEGMTVALQKLDELPAEA